jgi:hypothetical protein
VYLFSHLFSGVFIGIVFFHIWKDPRVIPVSIAGALFSDILDKPLSLLMPDVFGSTRTIGHTLILVLVLMIAALILWYRYGNILGMVFAGMVLIHQLLDMIWTLPVTWFFPLLGMFQKTPAAGGFVQFLWIEMTNPSEWVFALASCVFFLIWYTRIRHNPPFTLPDRILIPSQYGMAGILGITGACLVITGTGLLSGPVPVLYPGPDKTLMAGLVALCGAIVLGMIPVQQLSSGR